MAYYTTALRQNMSKLKISANQVYVCKEQDGALIKRTGARAIGT